VDLKVNLYFGSLFYRKSLLTHFQNVANVMKESDFDSKSHNGHLEEMSHVFKEVFV
jgi:hypothetical protein